MSAGADNDLANARRILVIGPPGAGKTTLAKTLSDRLGLTVVHLDRLFWQPGWIAGDRNEFNARIAEAMAADSWIIDGTDWRTLDARIAAADTVLWLDYDRMLCLSRVIWRRVRYHGQTRSDMTHGCPERIDLEFLRYIWSFRSKVGLRILASLKAVGAGKRVVRLASPRDTGRFLSSFK